MDRAKIEADFVAAAQFIKGHKKVQASWA